MSKIAYRPEIDGLRAIAVLGVLFFHAGFGFSGGFVGVDVFFVISGYLITKLIVRDLDQQKFSLADFWKRRIRRILPASVFVMTVVLCAGYALLLPADLKDLSAASVAQTLFSSNVYFWRTLGYFSGPADLMPLLHTWSLAVEEQFYFVFPLLLMATAKLRRRNLVALFTVAALASFVLSVWGTYTYPSATFYLLPSRAWELLVGAILAVTPELSSSRRRDHWMSLLGVGLIATAFFGLDSETRFPGAAALLPCVGTALVINFCAQTSTLVGKTLSFKPLVFVGLISYSLYLWHWPILAFLRYCISENLSVSHRIFAVIASFACAIASWRFVETPFRHRSMSTRQAVTGAFMTGIAICGVSLFIWKSGGLPSRLPPTAQDYAEGVEIPLHLAADTSSIDKGLPSLGGDLADCQKTCFVLWGDSHAMAVGELVNDLAAKHNVHGVAAVRLMTTPVPGTWRPIHKHVSVPWNDAVMRYIREKRIPNVILASRWAVNIEGRFNGSHETLIVDEQTKTVSPTESREVLRRGLRRLLSALEDQGTKVWVIGQVPVQPSNVARTTQVAALLNRTPPKGVGLASHSLRLKNAHKIINDVTQQTNASFVDPVQYCFDANDTSIIGGNGRSYYFDGSHLSPYGAEQLLTECFDPILAEIAANCRNQDAISSVENPDRTPPN